MKYGAQSKHAIVNKLNDAIHSVYKPKKINGRYWYGKLYFYGDCGENPLAATWVLDGMTPVDFRFVLEDLKDKIDVSEIAREYGIIERIQFRLRDRAQSIRESVAARLTPEEREACCLP